MMRRETLRAGMRVKHDTEGWTGVVKCPDTGTSFNQVYVVVDPECRGCVRPLSGHPWMSIPESLWVDHQDITAVDEQAKP